jgi:hypothetical protein
MKHLSTFENFLNEENGPLKARIAEITKLLKKQSFIGKVIPDNDSIRVFIDADDIAVMMMWEDGKIEMECEDADLSATINDDDKEILSYLKNVNDSF